MELEWECTRHVGYNPIAQKKEWKMMFKAWMAGESLERKVLGDFKRYSALLGFWLTAKDSVRISKGRGWGKSPYPLPSTAWTKTCLVTSPPPPTPPPSSFSVRWKVWWMMTHLLNFRIYCILKSNNELNCWEYLLISENNKNSGRMVIIILKIEIHNSFNNVRRIVGNSVYRDHRSTATIFYNDDILPK